VPWPDDADVSLEIDNTGPPAGTGNVGPGVGVPKEAASAVEYDGVMV
jgi:hypothetical protein